MVEDVIDLGQDQVDPEPGRRGRSWKAEDGNIPDYSGRGPGEDRPRPHILEAFKPERLPEARDRLVEEGLCRLDGQVFGGEARATAEDDDVSPRCQDRSPHRLHPVRDESVGEATTLDLEPVQDRPSRE